MKKVTLKFLLDENIDVRVAAYLREEGYSVLICPKGITNGAVLALAKQKKRILLTNDTDFSKGIHNKYDQHPGIIVFRIHPPSATALMNALQKFFIQTSGTDHTSRTYLVEQDRYTVQDIQ